MEAKATAVGTAGGKLILFGEHAVVHGHPAVAVGIGKGARVTAREARGETTLTVEGRTFVFTIGDGSREGTALARMIEALGIEKQQGIHLEATLTIPDRSGLGSSAALAAAAVRAVVALFGLSVRSEQLFEAVQASERVFHSNPSGLDASMALQGGAALYSKGSGLRPLALEPLPLSVFHTGERGNTAETVARFAHTLRDGGESMERRLHRIAWITKQGVTALEDEDLAVAGRLMTENHEILREFGVSCPSLDKIVERAVALGALGAKMTGGGGGGCAIVLSRPGDSVEEALMAEGFSRVEVE